MLDIQMVTKSIHRIAPEDIPACCGSCKHLMVLEDEVFCDRHLSRTAQVYRTHIFAVCASYRRNDEA